MDVAWSFFASPENPQEITPPRINMVILSKTGSRMHTGQFITYRVTAFPLIRVTRVLRSPQFSNPPDLSMNSELAPMRSGITHSFNECMAV
jgi:ligand-binding SRPBCC domain-containing protein